MDHILPFIVQYSHYAPWVIFLFLLLAGLNIPISIDVMIALSAFLAATTLTEYTFSLYISMLLGCYFSAAISYWVGRKIGIKLLQIKWFAKIFPQRRLERLGMLYKKYSWLTLILGRFIPFGIRNGIFMTAGMSKMPFGRFLIRDAIACFLWTTTCFALYYRLGLNYHMIKNQVKIINFAIFFSFSVTVIGWLWYKKHKKNRMRM